jgi:hypothetical protein
VVKSRVRKASRAHSLVGAGYTPRLVWLFGLMLRGIVFCTALLRFLIRLFHGVQDPVAAARYAHREWLPCILLGWFGSDFYWRILFGVNGPPRGSSFTGVPITIQHVKLI